jgi:hypothetical protein
MTGRARAPWPLGIEIFRGPLARHMYRIPCTVYRMKKREKNIFRIFFFSCTFQKFESSASLPFQLIRMQ